MKASEVFDLPLEANQESVYQQDGVNEYLYEFSVAEFNTPEQAKVAANCINHADALADALECLFESYKRLADSGDAGNWMLEDLEVGQQAIKALAAYRGAK